MILKQKAKLPPGTLVFTGEHAHQTTIKHIQFSENAFHTYTEIQSVNKEMNDLICVEGLASIDVINHIGKTFQIDAMVLEDILHTNQRTKAELHDNYAFYVVKYAYQQDEKIKYDYLSILLFKDLVITFSETKNRLLEDIINRIENKSSLIRKMTQDYIFYVLLDMIVDETIVVSSTLQSQLLEYEEKLTDLTQKDQVLLYSLRKELVSIKGMTNQLIDGFGLTKQHDNVFFHEKTKTYFKDVYDHLLNLRSRVESMNEISKNMIDVYMSHASHKMNQIMMTLTIFSAIFIPLSFIAGVFGMNFEYFPIFQDVNGMYYFIGLCIVIPVGMLSYFKWKKWF